MATFEYIASFYIALVFWYGLDCALSAHTRPTLEELVSRLGPGVEIQVEAA